MQRVLLVQLPIAQPVLGAKTGNIPLAAAWPAQAAEALPAVCFSDLDLQNRWLGLTAPDQFAEIIRRYCPA
jgi:hypothetical protein